MLDGPIHEAMKKIVCKETKDGTKGGMSAFREG